MSPHVVIQPIVETNIPLSDKCREARTNHFPYWPGVPKPCFDALRMG